MYTVHKSECPLDFTSTAFTTELITRINNIGYKDTQRSQTSLHVQVYFCNLLLNPSSEYYKTTV